MKKVWNTIFGLDIERSIWVEEEDLGREKVFYYKEHRYFVKIPPRINKHITLRLRGLGKKRFKKAGNLYLHVWLNKGEDIHKSLWLSESSAKKGVDKKIEVDSKIITMIVPPNSHHGLTIRLRGYGREGHFGPHAPALARKKRGNALVKLFVYPDCITPHYGSFENLSTDSMALEGWLYRYVDEVIQKVGQTSFRVNSLRAETIADLFNEGGWRKIFAALIGHLQLDHLLIELKTSVPDSLPGTCQRTVQFRNNLPAFSNYVITINEKFLDNPFAVAAILAHELCHVVYGEKIADTPKSSGYVAKSDKATLDEERTVDLLVFLFKMGEFQLRLARDTRLTFGYFNQEVFERMQGIVAKKLKI
jgi:hypothetical protein